MENPEILKTARQAREFVECSFRTRNVEECDFVCALLKIPFGQRYGLT